MRIVLCANHRAGYEALIRLLAEQVVDAESILVFTHDNFESRQILQECSVLGIRAITESINDCYESVETFEPDLILSWYYRYIIEESILSLSRRGCFNVHPALLPHYKGTFSSAWAIINGEEESGVTIHEMVSRVDAGNVLCQQKVKISREETAYSLYHKLVSVGLTMLPEAIKKISDGHKSKPQDPIIEKDKEYYPRELPFGGLIAAAEITFEEADRFVRAMHFPPHRGGQISFPDGSLVEISSIEQLNIYKPQFKNEGD